jgi:hypothetical protein
MKTFKTFIQLDEGVIPSGAGTKGWSHSGAKYFDQLAPEDKRYTLANDAHGASAGEKVEVVSKPYEVGGKMHVDIKHPSTGKKVPLRVDNLHKPGLENKSNSRDKEDLAFSQLTSGIEAAKKQSGKPYMNMKIGGQVHKIVGAHQIPGNPKADFALVNDKGEHVYHISHKDGSLPKHHQGYATSHKDVEDTDTFKNFIGLTHAAVGDNPDALEGRTVAAKLNNKNPEHQEIIKRSVWGKDHASGKTGINNVDVVHQGVMRVTRGAGGNYEIHSDNEMHRGDEFKHQYQMHVRKASDRTLPGTKIKGRFFVHEVGGRTNTDELKL